MYKHGQNGLPSIDLPCTINASQNLPSLFLEGDPTGSYVVQSGLPLPLLLV